MFRILDIWWFVGSELSPFSFRVWLSIHIFRIYVGLTGRILAYGYQFSMHLLNVMVVSLFGLILKWELLTEKCWHHIFVIMLLPKKYKLCKVRNFLLLSILGRGLIRIGLYKDGRYQLGAVYIKVSTRNGNSGRKIDGNVNILCPFPRCARIEMVQIVFFGEEGRISISVRLP